MLETWPSFSEEVISILGEEMRRSSGECCPSFCSLRAKQFFLYERERRGGDVYR